MDQPAHKSHLLKTIIVSQKPLMVWMRRLMMGLMVLLGLAGLRFAAFSLTRPNIYHKDFMQEYLMAKAILAGLDPYQPLPELATRFLGSLPQINLPHPTPHPPPVVFLGLPFSFTSYESAAMLWFVIELFFIAGSVYLMLKALELKTTPLKVVFLTTVLLGFRPFVANLGYGQLMTLLLLLLISSWLKLKNGKDLPGGILLGTAMAIKLVAWPLVLFLLIQRRWKAVLGAGLAFGAANLAAGLLMGFQRIVDYYVRVSAEVTPLYRAHEGNFSLFTIGYRLFEGTGAPGLSGLVARPLLSLPALALPVSLALVGLFLILSIWLATRCRSFEAAFSLLVCSSLLLSPIFWVVYLILAVIPMGYVLKRLLCLDFPLLETWVAFLMLGFLIGPREIIVGLLWRFPYEIVGDSEPVFSFASSLISLLPTLAVFITIWLVLRLQPVLSQESGSNGEVSLR